MPIVGANEWSQKSLLITCFFLMFPIEETDPRSYKYAGYVVFSCNILDMLAICNMLDMLYSCNMLDMFYSCKLLDVLESCSLT